MSNNFYINGRVAVLSTKLLSKDRLMRMAESDSVDEVLKSLYEVGYGGGMTVDSVNQYDKLLQFELDALIREYSELCNNQYAKRFFLLKYDYHNAKVLTKCKYMRVDYSGKCFNFGTIDSSLLQQLIFKDDYKDLPLPMNNALQTIDNMFAEQQRSALMIDITLDKAMYQDMQQCANASKINLLKQYYQLDADMLNLLTMFRVMRAGGDIEQYSQLIVDGGTLSQEFLTECFNMDSEKLLDKMYGNHLLPFVKVLTECRQKGNFFDAELFMSIEKHKLMSSGKVFEGIEPLLKYYLDKQKEIDAVRFVIIAVKSNMPSDYIKQHIKELYE